MGIYKPECFTNRELSWLQFNERVLSEARDKETPLFERLKFLSITASNLDEFFMIRVASLKDMTHAGYNKPDFAGLTPRDQLTAISAKVHDRFRKIGNCGWQQEDHRGDEIRESQVFRREYTDAEEAELF